MTEGDDVEVQATRSAELAGAAVKRGTCGKDVIDKKVMLPRGYGHPLSQCKGIFEVGPTRFPVVGRLRSGVHHPSQQGRHRGFPIH